MKYHGGVPFEQLDTENLDAVRLARRTSPPTSRS